MVHAFEVINRIGDQHVLTAKIFIKPSVFGEILEFLRWIPLGLDERAV